MSETLLASLQDRAFEAGFVASGGCDLNAASALLLEAAQKFEDWCDAGWGGEMDYLLRPSAREMRRAPQALFAGAKSVFVVLEKYDRRPQGFLDPAQGPRVARYIDGDDYHLRMKDKLQVLLSGVRARPAWSDLEWKICVDTSAVLERFWGHACGLGFVGKNTLLIHPTDGSYSFIGVVYLNKCVGSKPSPLQSRCGSCERCLGACPTGALTHAGLDARRCISYRTLEKKSKTTDELDSMRGTWIAGCDLCQEVCPFNLKAQKQVEGVRTFLSWQELMAEDEASYRQRVAQSALGRIKFEKARQNLELARLNAEAQAISL